jgi:hypothetical protein
MAALGFKNVIKYMESRNMKSVILILFLTSWISPVIANDVCNCKGHAGVGGPCYAGVGGAQYDGVGGPQYKGAGGPKYDGVGGPAYDGVGGACYAGVGGPCYSGVGGGNSCPAVCK